MLAKGTIVHSSHGDMIFDKIVRHGFVQRRIGRHDYGRFIVYNILGIAVYFIKVQNI